VELLSRIDFAEVLINMVVLLFSLSIHEAAHAWTADRLGDPTARSMGRVTLNPISHADPVGTLIFPLIGFVSGSAMFGWAKPVPVDTSFLRRPRRDHLLIAAAGPASNVLAAVGFGVGLRLLAVFFVEEISARHAVAYPLFLICHLGMYVNVILAVFNLLPIPPLDGSWVLGGVLPPAASRLMDQIRPYGFVLLVALLWSGALGHILSPVLNLVRDVVL
jgi:Zn-dependent protease